MSASVVWNKLLTRISCKEESCTSSHLSPSVGERMGSWCDHSFAFTSLVFWNHRQLQYKKYWARIQQGKGVRIALKSRDKILRRLVWSLTCMNYVLLNFCHNFPCIFDIILEEIFGVCCWIWTMLWMAWEVLMVSAFLFQEKKAAELAPSSNSIRWNFGPSGTVVSFAEDVGLPSFFNSGPSRSVLFVTLNCVLVKYHGNVCQLLICCQRQRLSLFGFFSLSPPFLSMLCILLRYDLTVGSLSQGLVYVKQKL